jgi:hypothetical protein
MERGIKGLRSQRIYVPRRRMRSPLCGTEPYQAIQLTVSRWRVRENEVDIYHLVKSLRIDTGARRDTDDCVGKHKSDRHDKPHKGMEPVLGA